tara:strand:+ start:78871 stop:79506 length:636 start_codon:yes stop_codon:yes gene_type:complete
MKLILPFVLLFTTFSLYAEENSNSDFKHSVSFGFDLATTGSFEDGESDDITGPFDSELIFDSGLSIGYEYFEAKEESWGKGFGVSYHNSREVEELVIDGEDYDITGDAAEITLLKVYANLIYRWNTFYIPFGVNITSVSYEPPSSYDGSVESTGGLGFNFGLGWFVTEQFAIEYMGSSNIWTLEAKSDSSETDYGDGVLAVATLKLKYIFK